MTTTSEPSVKCRHCGEVIEQVIANGRSNTWLSASSSPRSVCLRNPAHGSWHEPPICTVLSAEDRERLNEAYLELDSIAAIDDVNGLKVAGIMHTIRAVLANAGGGE